MLGHRAIEVVQRLQRRALVAHDVPLHEVRQGLGKLVAHVLARRHREDVVQLLEGALLRLGDPEEDHDQRGHVQAGVEAERAHGVEGEQQARERDGEDGGPEEAGRDGPGHADLAVGEREDLGRVGEGDGALAGGVEGREEEDEEGNQSQVGLFALGNDEAETCGQECPCHLWEGEEEERTTAVGIDRPDSGPGEDEVDQAEAEGGEEGIQIAGASFDEDGGRVEGYNVDTAHLLRQHNGEGSQGGAADTRDCEELDEAGEVVALADDIRLLQDLGVNVVQITSGLEGSVS